MRGKSPSSSSSRQMEVDKVDKLKEEPHLSGAYIRSLVKQLTTSRSKDGDNTQTSPHKNLSNTKITQESFSNQQLSQQSPPQQHKKQVRRRLHTSRPYQERLLNMAEARREIVTALKFHRAAMKQANELNPPPPDTVSPLASAPPPLAPLSLSRDQGKMKSRRNPRTYASSTNTTNGVGSFSNYDRNRIPYSSWSQSSPSLAPLPSLGLSSPYVVDNFNVALPNQTLGLNLNLHDFNNIDASLYHNNIQFVNSSPSTSSSPPPNLYTQADATMSLDGPPVVADSGLHQAMDDVEMAEIRSLGEQHDMEWNDTMNLVTSAWWFKFLKTMEVEPMEEGEDESGYNQFDQVMEFPAWLSANESCCFLQQEECSDEYLQDPALPCMEIGEIEGLYEEWLA